MYVCDMTSSVHAVTICMLPSACMCVCRSASLHRLVAVPSPCAHAAAHASPATCEVMGGKSHLKSYKGRSAYVQVQILTVGAWEVCAGV